jgi:hypothetical protein
VTNLPSSPPTAWQQLPGGFQLSYLVAGHPYLLLLSQLVTDARTGDVFVLIRAMARNSDFTVRAKDSH